MKKVLMILAVVAIAIMSFTSTSEKRVDKGRTVDVIMNELHTLIPDSGMVLATPAILDLAKELEATVNVRGPATFAAPLFYAWKCCNPKINNQCVGCGYIMYCPGCSWVGCESPGVCPHCGGHLELYVCFCDWW
jgi:hypothetical protein